MFLGAHAGAGVAKDDGQTVGFVILDETVITAKHQLQAILGLPEGILRDKAYYFRFQIQLNQ